MVTGDPHLEDKWDRLPNHPAEAIDNWEASAFARRAFSDAFVDMWAAVQRVELATFASQVTDWELARYKEII